MEYLFKIMILIFAYLLGSIPFGLVLARKFAAVDIRRQGSGNIGATNVRRTAGTFLGLLTLAGDIFKGAFPVWLASLQTQDSVFISLTALTAFLGHLYPVYLKFKDGGKGVATAAGCFLTISPLAVLISLIVFAGAVRLSWRVSAGSLAGSACLPVSIWVLTLSNIFTACAALISILIFIRHKDNIRRLLSGIEPTL